jgi:glycosyltransferase involved in cell wall biosynthesis
MSKKYEIKTDDISFFDMPKIAIVVIKKYGLKAFFYKTRNYLLIKFGNKNFLASRALDVTRKVPGIGNFSVLFVIGCKEGESKRYRVYNVAEYLHLGDFKSEIIEHFQVSQYMDKIDKYDIIYLSRVAYDSRIENLIKEAKKRNIVTIFEVDDLVFDLSVVSHVDAIKEWKKSEVEHYKDGVRRYQKTLRNCDYFLGTNEFLVNWVQDRFKKKSFVLRNALNSIQISSSTEALKLKNNDPAFISIGYFSGSSTHQKDFLEVELALLSILEKYKNVKFLLGGFLELSSKFDKFQDRIIKIPFTNWQKLPFEISKLDINLAPLEYGNPYCESKSELKYFEAALLKVPTIASPVDSFRFSIQDGINGYLASTSDEWFQKIENLIVNKDIRYKIGESAFEHTIKNYHPKAMKVQTINVFNAIISDYRESVLNLGKDKLVINWVIPEPSAGSGGHRNIFRAVKNLQKFGHYVRLYSLVGHYNFSSSEQLGEFIDANFFPTGAEYHLGVENFEKADAYIATHWSTIEPIWKNKEKAKKLFYFVQDYEPMFYAMGNDYIEAENTYKLGLNCITSGPWCTKILKEKFNANADYFKFPVDIDTYYPRPYISSGKRIVFFARPEMPRRCYPLGIKALEIFAKNNPDVEIILYGSSNIDSSSISFKHVNRGILETIDQLAELYSSASVGIVFSTTNPSLVPYEMMACGLPVVDLDYEDNWTNYESRENIMLVDTLPEKIAEGIEKILKDKNLQERLSKNGLELVKSFPNEEETARRIESLILKEFV